MVSGFIELLIIAVIIIFIISVLFECYLILNKKINEPRGNIVNQITIITSAMLLGRFLFAGNVIVAKDSKIELLELRISTMSDEINKFREKSNAQLNQVLSSKVENSSSMNEKVNELEKNKNLDLKRTKDSNPTGSIVHFSSIGRYEEGSEEKLSSVTIICFQVGQSYSDKSFSLGVYYISSSNEVNGKVTVGSKVEELRYESPGRSWVIENVRYTLKTVSTLRNEFCVEINKS